MEILIFFFFHIIKQSLRAVSVSEVSQLGNVRTGYIHICLSCLRRMRVKRHLNTAPSWGMKESTRGAFLKSRSLGSIIKDFLPPHKKNHTPIWMKITLFFKTSVDKPHKFSVLLTTVKRMNWQFIFGTVITTE